MLIADAGGYNRKTKIDEFLRSTRLRIERNLLAKKSQQSGRLADHLVISDKPSSLLYKRTDGTNEKALSEAEIKANRKLTISSLALTFAAGGAILYPPLKVLSILFTVIALQPYVVRAYSALIQDKKIGVAFMDALSSAGPLLTGHVFLSAFAIHLSNLSRKLLIKTEDHSQTSLTNLFGTQPRTVWVLQEGFEVEIAFDALVVGDVVVVDIGQTIPIDGTIRRGVALIDQRTLTGESQPVEKSMGESIFASTVLLSGRIEVEVEKTGKETVAAQIGEILSHTADFKSLVQSRGQRIVEKGVLPTLAAGLVTWPLFGAQSAVAALGASFGYHMRHAAPISVLNYLRIASGKGILVKDGRSLELLSEVDTFVFDKTGTLTEDIPMIGKIYTCAEYYQDDLLQLAAAAEYRQTHPIALAIQNEAHSRGLTLPSVYEAKYDIGYGIQVQIEQNDRDGKKQMSVIRVGSRRFMEKERIVIDGDTLQIEQDGHQAGYSVVYVAVNHQLGGIIELQPRIRPEAKAIVDTLKRYGIDIAIISGDHETPTRRLAEELGIEQYFAETLPQNKAQLIEGLQNQGKFVCFVGDGINDAIALKKANVSISLQGASTAATDSASIVLMDASLSQIIPLLDLSHSLDKNLKTTTVMTIVPGIICIGGIFIFHMGIMGAVALYYTALGLSLGNAMLPLVKHLKEQQDQNDDRK